MTLDCLLDCQLNGFCYLFYFCYWFRKLSKVTSSIKTILWLGVKGGLNWFFLFSVENSFGTTIYWFSLPYSRFLHTLVFYAICECIECIESSTNRHHQEADCDKHYNRKSLSITHYSKKQICQKQKKLSSSPSKQWK